MNNVSTPADLFSLTLHQSEATYLHEQEIIERRDRVRAAFDLRGLLDVRKIVDEYIAGDRELTAVELYLKLEQTSCLILFHTLPRRGERNKHANGLQQSYGDHIRLMMLGFDMFDQSNIDWAMKRRWQAPVTVDRPELEKSVDRYHQLDLSRSEKVAIWITSALHDYGKVFRRGYGLDAEDAVPLCADLLDALAPDGMAELIQYGIRNHDLIEHTVTGDTPCSFITDQLKQLPDSVQSLALPMLGLIQHIGAASLGEGRLSKAKLDIYNACLDGSIVADAGVEARLGRMLFGGQTVPDASATARASRILSQQSKTDRESLSRLLDRTVLLGWAPVREQILAEENRQDDALSRLIATLLIVGNIWSKSLPTPDHIVFARPKELAKCTGIRGDMGARADNEDTSAQLLNGAVALILR